MLIRADRFSSDLGARFDRVHLTSRFQARLALTREIEDGSQQKFSNPLIKLGPDTFYTKISNF